MWARVAELEVHLQTWEDPSAVRYRQSRSWWNGKMGGAQCLLTLSGEESGFQVGHD